MERKGAMILVLVGFIVWVVGWLLVHRLAFFMAMTMFEFVDSAFQLVTGFYILQPIGILFLVLGAILLVRLTSKQEKKEHRGQQDI